MIDVATLSVIRRWALREQLSIREIARRTGLSRNTIKKYLRAGNAEPNYAKRVSPSKLDPYAHKLSSWLKSETAKSRKQRRTCKQMHADLVALGYTGSYNRVAAFIESQLHKFAASRDKDIEAKTTTGVGAVAAAPATTPAAPAFDIAKFAGIFAAMGLAVGAIGTTLAAVVSGLFALSWWQIPLVLIGVLVVISGPSMMMAFLTLRRRNLGPLLDANGWAVNTRARINVPFGASLTGLATLPPGSSRSLVDPFAEKKSPWRAWMMLGAVIVMGAVMWYQGVFAGLLG